MSARLSSLLEASARQGDGGAAGDGAGRGVAGDGAGRALSFEGLGGNGQTQAAVLVPIYELADEPHVVLTRRHAGLRRHAGEISFPGGRKDPSDLTLQDTALREAEEEIGLPREAVSLVGALARTSTFATNYMIHPFVGTVMPGHLWSVSPREVEEVIELPLRELARSLTRTELTRRGFTFETSAYVLSGHVIWGATARILDDLLSRLSPLLSSDEA